MFGLLLKYCELDTLAEVMIVNELRKIVKGKKANEQFIVEKLRELI